MKLYTAAAWTKAIAMKYTPYRWSMTFEIVIKCHNKIHHWMQRTMSSITRLPIHVLIEWFGWRICLNSFFPLKGAGYVIIFHFQTQLTIIWHFKELSILCEAITFFLSVLKYLLNFYQNSLCSYGWINNHFHALPSMETS